MNLGEVYINKDKLFVDVTGLNEEIALEYDKDTNKVLELHFSVIVEVNRVLEHMGYIIDEEQLCYYNSAKNTLKVPLKKN